MNCSSIFPIVGVATDDKYQHVLYYLQYSPDLAGIARLTKSSDLDWRSKAVMISGFEKKLLYSILVYCFFFVS